MPTGLTPLPDGLGESFSVRRARDVGASPRRLQHPGLRAPFHGVRLVPDDGAGGEAPEHGESAGTVESRMLTAEITRLARAFAQIAPETSFFSHATAAVLWGLPVPLRLLRGATRVPTIGGAGAAARAIDVALPGRARASRAEGVRGHQLSATLVTVQTVDGLRVSSPASTWAMLAGELTVDELIELGDGAVRIPRRRGMERGIPDDALSSIAKLRAAAHAPQRRHRAKLLEALEFVRVGSASPPETRVRVGCRRAGLPEPELDYDVIGLDGEAIGYTEIAFPDYRLLVECEGDHHRTDRKQWNRDIDKHTACADAGFRVLRLTAKHTHPDAAPAVARIRKALVLAGWRP